MLSPLIAIASAASACFLYLLAAAVYNLYLHPLSGLPGPRSWIVFPLLRHIAAMRGLFDIHMREFHDHYGDVVRYALLLFSRRSPQIVLTMLVEGSIQRGSHSLLRKHGKIFTVMGTNSFPNGQRKSLVERPQL